MKDYYLLLLLFAFKMMLAQTPTRVEFHYDQEGNQTERIICLGCSNKTAHDSMMTSKTVTQVDLTKNLLKEQISYYPNPVREELYIKWTPDDESKYISSIEVYSISGQSLQKHPGLNPNAIVTVPFLNYPSGFYNVVLVYNNGEKKVLKVVKK